MYIIKSILSYCNNLCKHLNKSDIWLKLAIALSILCVFFSLTDILLFLTLPLKVLGVLCLCMDCILLIRYKLWKNRYIQLLVIIIFWIIFSGLVTGGELQKVFGGKIIRNWFICILVSMIGIVLSYEKMKRWLLVLISVMLASLTILFVIFLYNGTRGLLDVNFEVNMLWGLIKLGRLHAFGNANVLAPATATYILGCIWVTIHCIRSQKRFMYPVLTILFLLGITVLSLTRSRGAFLGLASAIGTIVFYYLYKKKRSTPFMRIFICITGALLTTIVTAVILYMPKKVYDKAIICLYEKNVQAGDEYDIHEMLEPYSATYAIDNLSDRLLIWPAVFRLINEEPQRWLVGESASRIDDLVIDNIYEDRPEKTAVHSHNGYIEQLLIVGLPGLILLIILMAIWIKKSIILLIHSSKTLTALQLTVPFIVAACINGIVEIYPFPYKSLYLTTYFCFIAGGCIYNKADAKLAAKNTKV